MDEPNERKEKFKRNPEAQENPNQRFPSRHIPNSLIHSYNMQIDDGTPTRQSLSWSFGNKENIPDYELPLKTCSYINNDANPSHVFSSSCTQPSSNLFKKRRFLPDVSSVSSSLLQQFEGVSEPGEIYCLS